MDIQANDNNEEETEWKSCCLRVDKGMVKYIIQIGILGGLIIFSSVMLVLSPECNTNRNYASLLMVCIGIIIPQPHLN